MRIAKYTEPSIAEGLGVVGSCSAHLQIPGAADHGLGGFWPCGQTILRYSVLGVRVKVVDINYVKNYIMFLENSLIPC